MTEPRLQRDGRRAEITSGFVFGALRRCMRTKRRLWPLLMVPWPLLLGRVAFGSGSVPAAELKLPPDIVYETSVHPDSAVIFRHETHVAMAGQKCLGCHPQPFRMLTPTHHTSHRAMNAGQSCGACHDGRHAFGVMDRSSCGTCHAGRHAARGAGAPSATASSASRAMPKPFAFPRGEASPGRVTFRHETHVSKASCATCHPKPFAMAPARTRPGGGMHEASACGGCHDGTKTFDVGDADACSRCHLEGGGSP